MDEPIYTYTIEDGRARNDARREQLAALLKEHLRRDPSLVISPEYKRQKLEPSFNAVYYAFGSWLSALQYIGVYVDRNIKSPSLSRYDDAEQAVRDAIQRWDAEG